MPKKKSRLRRTLTRWFKPLELFGRTLLQYLLSVVLWLPNKTPRVPPQPRILVIRLDPRVGNLLMLTPFLESLKRSFPGACVSVLCDTSMVRVMSGQPSVDEVIPFRRWQPVLALLQLRSLRFDVVFDAGSFPGVAVTHPVIARLSGGGLIVGPDRGPLGRVYHVTVPVLAETEHEIAQRLQLLTPFPSVTRVTRMTYRSDAALQQLDAEHAAFVAEATPYGAKRTVLLVVGSREPLRRLTEREWAALARALLGKQLAVSLVWGPGELPLAEAVAALCPGVSIAPPSTLDQLVALYRAARGVIGNDTGTSHLSVAIRARTLVCFVWEPPSRYGHRVDGSDYIDLRTERSDAKIVDAAMRWLDANAA